MKSSTRRRLAAAGATLGALSLAALLIAPAAGADAANLTWTGGASSGNWSQAANWSGGGPAADGSYGVLNFGDLSTACNNATTSDACYTSKNDISGLSVSSVDIDEDTFYSISGDAITVGSGGIQAEPGSGDVQNDTMTTPITLGADQTWTLNGGGELGLGVNFGKITGADTLGINLVDDAELDLMSSVQTGALTINGTGLLTIPNDLNNTSAGPVVLSNGVELYDQDGDTDQVGPLTVESGSELYLGGLYTSGAVMNVNGALDLDDATVQLYIDQPAASNGAAPTPVSDYSGITSTGDVDLDGSTLDLSQGALSSLKCVDLRPGDVYPLISTTGGTLTGTFSGLPNGSTLTVKNLCDKAASATVTINYTSTAVTATVASGGHAGDLPAVTTRPKVSGKFEVGYTLEANEGKWSGSPKFQLEWSACSATTGRCTSLGSKPTLLITPKLVDDYIDVSVTATNAYGKTTTETDPMQATAPSTKMLKTTLGKLLAPGGKLEHTSSYTVNFTAPYGHVSVTWKHGRTTVASGHATYKKAAKGKLTVKITEAGSSLLGKDGKLDLKGQAKLTGWGGKNAVTTSHTVKLG